MGSVVCCCLQRACTSHKELVLPLLARCTHELILILPLLAGLVKAPSHLGGGKPPVVPRLEGEGPPDEATQAAPGPEGLNNRPNSFTEQDREGPPGTVAQAAPGPKRPPRLHLLSERAVHAGQHELPPSAEGEPAHAAPSPASARPWEQRPEPGDLVKLGRGATPEFVGHTAVVTDVAEKHCTVAVLDGGCCFGIGECWPNLPDIVVTSRDWRLGARVVIDGFRGAGTKRMNGATGTIARHPQSGHPSFICKPAAPDEPRLTLCVHLDAPAPGGKSSVLVEPRFIRRYSTYLHQVVRNLDGTMTEMGAPRAPR